MKKIFKYLIIILIVFFAYQFIDSKINPKPFRFEDFNSQEDTKQRLLELYPYGSSYNKLINDIKKVGATCKIIPKEKYENDPNYYGYREIQHCKYNTGTFSMKPWVVYEVSIGKGIKDEIIHIGAFSDYLGL